MASKTPEEQAIQDNDLSDNKIVDKYKAAAQITHNALQHVMSLCVPGAKVVDLCIAGDQFIDEAAAKIYNRLPATQKGIGHPTCVSLNHLTAYVCPLSGDEQALAVGDMIKIDITSHVDGYLATLAHTVKLGEEGLEVKWTGRQADVMAAAYTAAEAAIRMLRPGKQNGEVTEVITKSAAEFKCVPMAGLLSHQMERNNFDGEKCILNQPDTDNRYEAIEDCTIAGSEVYSLDIVMSSGDGRPRQADVRATVYKRVPEMRHQLKMKASRELYSQILREYPNFPFTLRAMDDEKKARFAVTELETNNLVEKYPIGSGADGDFLAQVKITVMVMPNGAVNRLTGGGLLDMNNIGSEHTVSDPTLRALLATSLGKKKKKKKKAAKVPDLVAAQE